MEEWDLGLPHIARLSTSPPRRKCIWVKAEGERVSMERARKRFDSVWVPMSLRAANGSDQETRALTSVTYPE